MSFALNRRTLVLALSAAAAALTFLTVVGGAWTWFNWAGPGPAVQDTTVVLAPGASLGAFAQDLEKAKVVRSAGLFRFFVKSTGADRKIRPGEYDFPAHASLAQVIQMMAQGQVVRHWVTVPEGMTSGQVLARLKAMDVLQGEADAPPEGSLLPQTYEVVRGQDRAQVIAAMRQARDQVLERLWAARAPNLPFHTRNEAVIIASIVEKETSVPSERAMVAAVYENRLAKGMRLEADPVVIYGLTRGDPLGHGLTKSELERMTPYNSYRVVGLPPTPIANPGEASLAAVLHPAKSDALYFVADGTGGHRFSATFEEHARNVAHWRTVESSRKPAVASTNTNSAPGHAERRPKGR